MADLDETETYAAAALFTLALYSSQVEVGIDRFHENADGEYETSVWGCPEALDLDEVLFGEKINAEQVKEFWGWDCCGKNGLCQLVYQHLNIPQKSWTGLLKIPETVGDVTTEKGIEDLIQIVERYSRMLDSELHYTKGSAVEFFSIERQRSIEVRSHELAAAAATFRDLKEDHLTSTSPGKKLNRNMERSSSRKLSEINEKDGIEEYLLISQELGENTDLPMHPVNKQDTAKQHYENSQLSDLEKLKICLDEQNASENGSSSSEAYEQYVESLKVSEQCPMTIQEDEDVVIPKAGFFPRSDYIHPASGQSCLALRALVKSSLCEEALTEGEEKKEESRDPLEVCIQWYDARCRIALMRVAHWLRIPWPTLSAFEMEAAMNHLRLKDDGSIKKNSRWIARWLKISAMAIGGGAAVAFTGGLAAPAVAAGLGAAVTLAGGGAAAATAVTGFAASTAGTATITTAFGAFGAHSTGSTMYRRTNNIKEFAFWDLSMDWEFEIDKKKAKLAKSSSSMWSWNRPSQKSDLTSESASMDDPHEKEGYVRLNNGEYSELDSSSKGTKKVLVVPGVEVAMDELAVTKSTNNYSDWWDNWLKAKERPDLFPLPINPRCQDSNLALTIAVSGIIRNELDFADPWKRLPAMGSNRFSIFWEPQLLKKVGDALVGLITSQVASETAKWFIKKYLYTGLLSAVAIPVLITTLVEVTVGNNWAMAMDHSVKAGELLAEYFLQGLHGNRPVTLIGYSLGARCIFRCLLTLHSHGKRGIIENVILLGAPVSLSESKWAAARSVVAGRFVNGYSTRDWVLSVIFRFGRGILTNVAGISPVNVPGIENVDLSPIVAGQTEYSDCMKDILAAINL